MQFPAIKEPLVHKRYFKEIDSSRGGCYFLCETRESGWCEHRNKDTKPRYASFPPLTEVTSSQPSRTCCLSVSSCKERGWGVRCPARRSRTREKHGFRNRLYSEQAICKTTTARDSGARPRTVVSAGGFQHCERQWWAGPSDQRTASKGLVLRGGAAVSQRGPQGGEQCREDRGSKRTAT